MSRTFTIYGASDDLIETDGVPGCDEFGAWCPDELVHGSFVLGGKMRIRAIYDGCWSFAIGQVDEDILLPDWPITITQHHVRPGEGGYSTLVSIEVPDDVSLVREADR